MRLLPFIWLTAHETGVLSLETLEFISKNQLKSKPSTFIKHIQKDLTLLNPHTLDSKKKKASRNSVLSIKLRKAQEGRNFLLKNISQSNNDFSKINILASNIHYVHFQVKMFWYISRDLFLSHSLANRTSCEIQIILSLVTVIPQ